MGDSIYKRLKLSIQTALDYERHQFVALSELTACDENLKWKNECLHISLIIQKGAQSNLAHMIVIYGHSCIARTCFVLPGFMFLDVPNAMQRLQKRLSYNMNPASLKNISENMRAVRKISKLLP